MDTKQCSKCGEVKGVGEFGMDKSKKHGIREQCKKCWNEKRRRVHNKKDHVKISRDKWIKKEAKKPLRKDDKRLMRLSSRVKAHFKRRYKKREKEAREVKVLDKSSHCKKFGYDFICMMDCNKYYIVKCKYGHLTKKSYSTMKNGCLECRKLKGVNNFINKANSRGYKVVGEYISTAHKIDMVCPNKHNVSIEAKSFLKGSGCNDCNNVGGYNYTIFSRSASLRNKDAVFYEFYFELSNRSYKEFGITINWNGRKGAYRRQGVKPFDISLTSMKLYDAFICEQEMKQREDLQGLRLKENPGFDGWTECFDVTNVDLFNPIHNS